MANDNKAKLIHGLSNFHMATVEQDDKDGVEYSDVEHVEGAVSVSVDPNTESETKYADNGPFAVLNSLSDIGVTMAAVDIPMKIKKEMFGQNEVNGVLFSNKDDIIKEVALGFEARIHGGGTRFYWLLKGTPEIIPIEHQTDEGSVESQDTELTITFTPLRHNGNWKAELDSELVTTDDWFEEVVYDEKIASELPSPDGGGDNGDDTP